MKRCHLFLFCILAATHLSAQGCADAGFCTAGILKTASASSGATKGFADIGVSGATGYGEQGTIIFIPQLELRRNLTAAGIAEIKASYYLASGSLGTSSGLGDIILTYTQEVDKQKEDWDISTTIGGRFSTGTADRNDGNGLPLPMPYQPNLGTTDLIAGLKVRHKTRFGITVGLQQPVLHYNNNGYYSKPDSGIDGSYHTYFSSRKLHRSGDVLLRIEYGKTWKQSGVTASTLFIHHLENDRITAPTGETLEVSGSKGLTLNVTLDYYTNFRNWRLEAVVGAPIVVRQYRPDGLTRSLVITPRITYFLFKKANTH